MNDERRLAALEAQIKTLTARVDDLFEALKAESLNTTKHLNNGVARFEALRGQVADLRECLNLTFREVHPGSGRDFDRIDAILHPKLPPDRSST
jgi:hypothetical protein